MAITFSEQDIELLGYSSAERQQGSDGNSWIQFRATAPAGLETIETCFVYLKSDCRVEDMQRAAAEIPSERTTYIVAPKSLAVSPSRLTTIFGPSVPIYVHEDLLWSKVQTIFGDYIQSLRDGIVTERYYVPPRSKTERIGDKLFDVVTDYLTRKSPKDDGTLLVLCANAGVGKTTLSRQLVKTLADNVERVRTIPVYVEASHWGRLYLESVAELWEIIDNSLRTFSSNLRMREGLFQHALKQGNLSFIFDGFDELCGHKSSQFTPASVLNSLAEISRQSSARIMITTRTMYWQSEIKDPPPNVRIEQIDYFNTQQAKGYFRKFFKEDVPRQNAAMQQYSELVQESFRPRQDGGVRNQFVNLPLCVAMVAEHVRQGGARISAEGSRQLLENVLLQICEREVARKTLRTRAAEQLRAFQEIAVAEQGLTNPTFSMDLLEAAGVATPDVKKFIDHPLLCLGSDGTLKFSYDFLAPYLRALYVADAVTRAEERPSSAVWSLLAAEANGKGFMLEHLESLLDQTSLAVVGSLSQKVPPDHREARSFLVHLAQALIRQDSNVVTREDRASRLFSLLMGDTFAVKRQVKELYLTGPLENLDLRGIEFLDCKFHDVTFRNCRADETTTFRRCSYSGELILTQEKTGDSTWAQVQLVECEIAFPASEAWSAVLANHVTPRSEIIKDVLRLGLAKFWQNGRLKTSLRKDDWSKGLLGRSGESKLLLQAMIRTGLVDEIHISGVAEGGYAYSKDSLADLQKFMDNQQMTGKILEVYEMLLKQ